jgi:branched-chain amino acid transport system substrate-binding protein
MKIVSRMAGLAAGISLSALLALAPATAAEIKIGAFVSATGPASFLGEPEEKTLKHYVDAINKAGGVNGEKIKLVIYDDGGDANKARTFATRLIEEDKVVAMVGGSTTGTTMAMIPVFEDAQIPFISLAGAVVIIEPVKKYTFKTPHTDRMACEKIFDDLKKRKPDQDRHDLGHGRLRRKSMKAQCESRSMRRYGIEILTEESYRPARFRHDRPAHQDQGQGRHVQALSTPASARARRS